MGQSSDTKDRVQAHLDNVFGKVPDNRAVSEEPGQRAIRFGQGKPLKGVESVFAVIKEAIDKLSLQPLFGETKVGLEALKAYIIERERHGMEKYGASLETWNGRDPLQDVIEEDVDRFAYLVQARKERADMVEMINTLKRKNAQLEKDLDAANTALAVNNATPGNGGGSSLEPRSHAAMAAGDPVQAPHARAYRDRICMTGLLPDERWPDAEDAVRDIMLACYANSALHGFWGEESERAIKGSMINGKSFEVIPEKLCLIHSEISEALEAYRAKDSLDRMHGLEGWLYYVTGAGKPEGYLTELADAFIRIGDLVGSMGLEKQFVKAVRAKMVYNNTRPHMHGKKC